MGDWQHPEHYSEAARHYAEENRASEVARFVELCLPVLREAAFDCGYTLAVHGSQRRDLDLVAIPWTEEASGVDIFIIALHLAVESCTGWGHYDPKLVKEQKPHGRIAITIVANFDLQLDVSIMPLVKTT